MREAFEKFVDSELGDVAVSDNGKYISPKIQKYWLTWQAATSAQSERIARLEEALRAVFAVSEKAVRGSAIPVWAGYENGLGEEFGVEMDAALILVRDALEQQ